MTKYLKDHAEKHQAELESWARLRQAESVPRISNTPVCDFCGDDTIVWIYASYKMSSGLRVKSWRWAACTVCSGLVDANEWGKLSARIEHRINQMTNWQLGHLVIKYAVSRAIKEFTDNVIKIE